MTMANTTWRELSATFLFRQTFARTTVDRDLGFLEQVLQTL